MPTRLARLLLVGSLTLAALRAQEGPATTPLPRVEVHCVDAAGKPVVGAEVHVFQARKSPDGRADFVASGPHRSDAEGRAIAGVALDFDGGRFDRWFYARVPGKLVGAERAFSFDVKAQAPTPTIRMEPARDVRGRVQVSEGLAPTSVRVRMLSLHMLSGDSPRAHYFPRSPDLHGLSGTLPDLFDADVAEDGTFTLRDLPPRMRLYLAAEGAGLAHTQWSNIRLPELRIPDLIELTMKRESAIEGRVVGPNAEGVLGAEVRVCLGDADIRLAFETRSDAVGKFRIAGLPAGAASIEVTSAVGLMRPRQLLVTAAEVLQAGNLPIEPGIEVRGSVRSVPDGAAVEGVGITAITDEGQQRQLGWTSTNGEGRFVLRLPTGGCGLYIAGVPAGYQRPSAKPDDVLRLDVRPGDPSLTEVRFEIQRAK